MSADCTARSVVIVHRHSVYTWSCRLQHGAWITLDTKPVPYPIYSVRFWIQLWWVHCYNWAFNYAIESQLNESTLFISTVRSIMEECCELGIVGIGTAVWSSHAFMYVSDPLNKAIINLSERVWMKSRPISYSRQSNCKVPNVIYNTIFSRLKRRKLQ